MNVAEFLERSARYFPHRAAFISIRKGSYVSPSYRDLNDAVKNNAGMLKKEGVMPGDRVALLLPNCPDFIIAYYAALRIGALPVSISPLASSADLKKYISITEPRLFIVEHDFDSEKLLAAIDRVIPTFHVVSVLSSFLSRLNIQSCPNNNDSLWDAHPNDPAAILFTGGTTGGEPKAALLSHGNIISNVNSVCNLLQLSEEDNLYCALPLFHVFGQNFIMNAAFRAGATLVLAERFYPNDLSSMLEVVRSCKVTRFFAVPLIFSWILENEKAISIFRDSRIRYSFTAAAKCPPRIKREWEKVFAWPLYEGWGLTECAPFATYNHEVFGACDLESVGVPIENVEVKIFQAGEEVNIETPMGESGEIAVRGPNVMLGYYNNPDATKSAIRDGWLRTGDIGWMDVDGRLYISDRLKDMIKVGGFQVWPNKVEEVIISLSEVKDAAVIGLADEKTGNETPVAFVVLREGARLTAEDIMKFCEEKIEKYAMPRRIYFADALPRSPAGKVLKFKLREEAERFIAKEDKKTEA